MPIFQYVILKFNLTYDKYTTINVKNHITASQLHLYLEVNISCLSQLLCGLLVIYFPTFFITMKAVSSLSLPTLKSITPHSRAVVGNS